MKCPKCQSDFESVVFDGIDVDRCSGCNGLWFDMLEKDDLLKIEGSESIDLGNDQVDPKYNEMRDIECPRCGQTMIPMVDKDQFHIKYESCPACYGTYFDAGEFRDLKDYTVAERFHNMMDALILQSVSKNSDK
jgi:Zn-finger nucleic acid-binding protein